MPCCLGALDKPREPRPSPPPAAAQRLPEPHARCAGSGLHPDALLPFRLGARMGGAGGRNSLRLHDLPSPRPTPHHTLPLLRRVLVQSGGYTWSGTITPAQLVTGIFTTSGYSAWVSPSVVRAGRQEKPARPTHRLHSTYTACAVRHCIRRRGGVRLCHGRPLRLGCALRRAQALARRVAPHGLARTRRTRLHGPLHPPPLPSPERILLFAGAWGLRPAPVGSLVARVPCVGVALPFPA